MKTNRIKELAENALRQSMTHDGVYRPDGYANSVSKQFADKFAEMIVREMCGLMEQAEDDAYDCFEPSERPNEYIEWLRDWQARFEKHFGVK